MNGSSSNSGGDGSGHDPIRRRTLFCVVAALGAVAFKVTPRSASAAAASGAAATVLIENFSAAGRSQGTVRVPKVVKTEAEWQAQLTGESFVVTRHAGTERAFTGATWNLHDTGLYRCICCDTALFDSRTKFESGTGWPSFYQPISKLNITTTTDTTFGFARTAVSCSRCDAHLGHVFDDGPPPTGRRYCMNSASLRFVPRA